MLPEKYLESEPGVLFYSYFNEPTIDIKYMIKCLTASVSLGFILT